MVLSSGFCVLAGDLGAQLALRNLSDVGGDLRLDAWLEGYNGGVSAGVIHTAEAMKKAKFPKDHGEMTGAWRTPNFHGDIWGSISMEIMGLMVGFNSIL